MLLLDWGLRGGFVLGCVVGMVEWIEWSFCVCEEYG